MIFYGNGSVWDSRVNKVLCSFIDGKCEVSKETDISFLVRHGYKHEPIEYKDNVEKVKTIEVELEAKPKVRPRKAVKNA